MSLFLLARETSRTWDGGVFIQSNGWTFCQLGISETPLSQLNTYKNVIIVQEYFNKDQPTYIYDSEGYFSKIGQHLPSLTQQYELVSPKLYKKK